MSEVAAPEQVPVAAAVNGEGEQPANGGEQPAAGATNGSATNGHSAAKKEKKKPIDPKEDPEGFLQQVLKSPAALSKVNHHILKWLQETVEEDEQKRKPLPGKPGAGSVEPKAFVQWLADGAVLAQLANKLAPSCAEPPHPADAKANLQTFVDFQQQAGVAPEHAVTVEQLQAPKWKTAYQALFKALFHLSTQPPHTLHGAGGLDAQQLADELANVAHKFPIFQRVRHSVSTILSELLAHTQSPAKGTPQQPPAENGNGNGNGHENGEASATNGTAAAAAAAVATSDEQKTAEAPAADVNGSK